MELNLKPSHKAVKDYYDALQKFTSLGYENEGAVKNAFAKLLRTAAKRFGFTLIEEYPIKKNGASIAVDGALLDDFKLSHGYWEAKDTQDDLEKEVKKKFIKGYPQDNIIFQAPERALVYRNGSKVFDETITEPERLIKALEVFFSYQPPHYPEWRKAVEEFRDKVPQIAKGILELIEKERQSNTQFIEAFNGFADLCRRSINPNLAPEAIEEMLIQHLLTIRIFSKIFDNPDFANKNIIAREIEKVIDALTSHHFSKGEFLKSLDPFYLSIENTASSISDFSQKQDFLNTVYEKFFQGFSVKIADTHGIVYTPQSIVNFIVNSVEDILQREFNRSLSDENVHILDPFVGTGNFIIHVMRKIKRTALPYKYANEIHCNEVMLLPYYIASMNIEHANYEMTGEYQPFEGICLVDTFGLAEPQQGDLFTEKNTERVQNQKKAPIFVILGNPPYNAGQVNENDNNKNRKYPVIDKRVKDTYAKDSKAQLVRKLRDPYIKAFRWASDRIGKEGIIAFVTNNSYIDDISFDGMRKHLFSDFNHIYVFDLKGNIRKDSMRDGIPLGEKHTVFGLSAMVGVSITLLIKNQKENEHRIFYYNVHFRATRKEKFELIDNAKVIHNLPLKEISPDRNYTWLKEGLNETFNFLLPLGIKKGSRGDEKSIFNLFFLGISTNRDSFAYSFNGKTLKDNVSFFSDEYHKAMAIFPDGKDINIDNELSYDKIKWSRNLKRHLKKRDRIIINEESIRKSMYRPFVKKNLYFSDIIIDELSSNHKLFPIPETEQENLVICVRAIGNNKPFHSLMTNIIPDLHLTGDSQCFPFYTYSKDGSNRTENITDWSLEQFLSHYSAPSITKWDIFYYIYGVLHHPGYREKYAANLRRELPRIPFAPDFSAFSEAGKLLADLHVNYEHKEEYPLAEIETPGKQLDWRVEKMKLSKDKTRLIYNDFLTLADIPPEVYEYRLGNRSALEWIVDQYRVTTDKRSGITNDPNNEEDRWYIRSLIKKIVTVSLETVRIVKGLQKFEENTAP
ncbi:MAG: type ISP restriction/modification enzyme [Candidatus Latescibacter sp.]|nr:type ISP restriction/modification enzyme [Candidatus Latescibacter sp.]